MTAPPGAAGNPFWDFSLALYAAPGVAGACLGLQERLDADANLLLFCCWAGSRGHALDDAALDRLLAAVAEWHAEVVRPLRAARTWLKLLVSGDSQATALRERIKALELEAERLEQDRLHAALPLSEGPASRALAAANLDRYLARLASAAGGPDRAALALLAGRTTAAET
jgi:uncharacterized protein (TIGR02444 family)